MVSLFEITVSAISSSCVKMVTLIIKLFVTPDSPIILVLSSDIMVKFCWGHANMGRVEKVVIFDHFSCRIPEKNGIGNLAVT